MSKVYSVFGLNKNAKVAPIDMIEEMQSDSVLEYEVIPRIKLERRKSFCSREYLESQGSMEYLENQFRKKSKQLIRV